MTPKEVLYDMSHANLVMLGAAIPSLDTNKETKADGGIDWDGPLDNSNPDNFSNVNDQRKRI